jgi:hypothetical protein
VANLLIFCFDVIQQMNLKTAVACGIVPQLGTKFVILSQRSESKDPLFFGFKTHPLGDNQQIIKAALCLPFTTISKVQLRDQG